VGNINTLYDNLITNYLARVNISGNPLSNTGTTSKLLTRIVGYDKIDYLVEVNASGGVKKIILRAKFDLGPSVNTCDWSYRNDSFKVQIALLDISPATLSTYNAINFVEVINTANFIREGVTDNVSPLLLDPEFY
jgi:hypothetical protein